MLSIRVLSGKSTISGERMDRRNSVLIVAEKDSVARAFAKYLSRGRYRVSTVGRVRVYLFEANGTRYSCVGLRGHLMDYDFPKKLRVWHKVDPKVLFSIEPVRVFRKETLDCVRVLRSLARNVGRVILALDADIEGEAIAFEVMDIIKKVNPRAKFERVWFTAITKEDILSSLRNPRSPNHLWAWKSFSRMKIDLVVGAAFTRALTLLVKSRTRGLLKKGKFLSYGPCQTPVLYLVVQRYRERLKFKSRKYYIVEISVDARGKVLTLRSVDKFDDRSTAERVAELVRQIGSGRIVEALYVKRRKHPPIPLNTIELERRASRFLNIRAKTTLDIAEELYRDGLISYPRTETTIYPPTLDLRRIVVEFSRNPVYRDYTRKLIKIKLKPTSGSSDDRAHPPIYPVRSAKKEYVVRKFGTRGWKIYDLVVRHFLATLSPPAEVEVQEVTMTVDKYRFRVKGLALLDKGYLEIYPYELPVEKRIPRLDRGELVDILRVRVVEEKTKPPPFLSESELLKLMEKYGIGTDATMQDHIHTNVKRRYFIIKGRQCIPTPLGVALIDSLERYVPEIVKPEVRGSMEKELKMIQMGLSDPQKVFYDMRHRFLKYFEKFEKARVHISNALINALYKLYQGVSVEKRSSTGFVRASELVEKEEL